VIAPAVGPVSLRISVTDRCQLRCIYCVPPEGITVRPRDEILRFEEITRFVRVIRARFGLRKVHLTGGEPLLRRDITRLISMLSAEGVPDLALTTNGVLLARMASEVKRAGLHRVNVSLDSLDRRTYRTIARTPALGAALAGIEEARRVGLLPVKINTIVLRGVNDHEVVSLAGYAIETGCSIRFLELMPIGCARARFTELFVPADEIRRRLSHRFRLKPLPRMPGSSARYYRAAGMGRQGMIGFITPVSRPFCADCRRLRLTSTGRLIACLASGEGPCVREALRQSSPTADERLATLIGEALTARRPRRCFTTPRPMASVGG